MSDATNSWQRARIRKEKGRFLALILNHLAMYMFAFPPSSKLIHLANKLSQPMVSVQEREEIQRAKVVVCTQQVLMDQARLASLDRAG